MGQKYHLKKIKEPTINKKQLVLLSYLYNTTQVNFFQAIFSILRNYVKYAIIAHIMQEGVNKMNSELLTEEEVREYIESELDYLNLEKLCLINM